MKKKTRNRRDLTERNLVASKARELDLMIRVENIEKDIDDLIDSCIDDVEAISDLQARVKALEKARRR